MVAVTPKNTTNTIDVDLVPGEWTGLAFGGADPAVLLDGGAAGVNVLTQTVHLSFEQSDAVTVTGLFYLTDTAGANPSGYQEIGPRPGGGGHQFVHTVSVPANKHLRFKIRVDRTDGGTGTFKLLHRSESSRTWTV